MSIQVEEEAELTETRACIETRGIGTGRELEKDWKRWNITAVDFGSVLEALVTNLSLNRRLGLSYCT